MFLDSLLVASITITIASFSISIAVPFVLVSTSISMSLICCIPVNFYGHSGHGTCKRDRRHQKTQDHTHQMKPHAPGGCSSGAPDTAVVFFIPQNDRKH